WPYHRVADPTPCGRRRPPPVSSSGSVTAWIGKLRAGDRSAAEPLLRCYFERLVKLARAKLRRLPTAMADEEDVALGALDSFCRGAGQGRFPHLSDRDDLWRLLLVITERKATRLIRNEGRIKRGGAKVRHEGSRANDSTHTPGLDHVPAATPTPELAA